MHPTLQATKQNSKRSRHCEAQRTFGKAEVLHPRIKTTLKSISNVYYKLYQKVTHISLNWCVISILGAYIYKLCNIAYTNER